MQAAEPGQIDQRVLGCALRLQRKQRQEALQERLFKPRIIGQVLVAKQPGEVVERVPGAAVFPIDPAHRALIGAAVDQQCVARARIPFDE